MLTYTKAEVIDLPNKPEEERVKWLKNYDILHFRNVECLHCNQEDIIYESLADCAFRLIKEQGTINFGNGCFRLLEIQNKNWFEEHVILLKGTPERPNNLTELRGALRLLVIAEIIEQGETYVVAAALLAKLESEK